MTFTIYKITNIVNGKCYVGCTKRSIKLRWHWHQIDASKKSSLPFHKAIREFGIKSFAYSLLYQTESLIEAQTLEALAIREQNAHFLSGGYNMTWGHGTTGWVPNEEWRRNRSISSKQHVFTAIQRSRISKANTGKGNGRFGHTATAKCREAASKASLGKFKGIVHSKEFIEKRRQGMIRARKERRKLYTLNGTAKPLFKWCKQFGVRSGRVLLRLNSGCSFNEALIPPK